MLTGDQCRGSLRDGRRVFLGGRLIEDVTSDPGFKGVVDFGGWHLVANVEAGGGLHAQSRVTMKHANGANCTAGLDPVGVET